MTVNLPRPCRPAPDCSCAAIPRISRIIDGVSWRNWGRSDDVSSHLPNRDQSSVRSVVEENISPAASREAVVNHRPIRGRNSSQNTHTRVHLNTLHRNTNDAGA